jgi:hypothetical protein
MGVAIVIYVILACILTPLALEMFNRRTAGNQLVTNVLKGWPAYLLNVVFCVVAALIVCVLPYGPGFSFGMWALVTFAIYFGNQFIFQIFIKTLAKYRKE